MKQYVPFLFLLFLLLIANTDFAQVNPIPVSSKKFRRCSTMEILAEAIKKDPALPEKWKAEGERQYKQYLKRQQQSNLRSLGVTAGPIIIPIVFHIVDVASIVNSITDRDIYEQVEILNKDFSGKKINDYLKVIPPEIVARLGIVPIKFVLARRTPSGIITTGIERKIATSPNHINIKSTATGGLDAWDTNKYFNVWCGTFNGSETGLLGIATFPFMTGEPQGVVIATSSLPYASNTNRTYSPNYSEGSTLSHETGHYFYLWHTFGDDPNCNNNDFQIQPGWPLPSGAGPEGDDTPLSKGTSSFSYVYGDPSMNYKDGCAPETFGMMYGSFMNYFDDRALFMFSDGHRKRVEGCINLYRPGLLTTDGATPPSATVDAFLVDVSPRGTPERKSFLINNTPFKAIIRNSGTNTLTSVNVNVSVDGNSPASILFPLNLAPGNDTTLNLASINGIAGNHTLTVYTSLPNGGSDNFLNNDTLQSFINIHTAIVSLPWAEDFTTAIFPPPGWLLWNPNTGSENTWTRNTVSGYTIPGSAFFDNNTITQEGSLDELITPVIDPGTATTAALSFKVAYAVYDNIDVSSWDGLEVYISGDGGFTYTMAYKKTGTQLTTVPATTNPFSATPLQTDRWRNESIDLTPYIIPGQKIIIKFRNLNAHGNNLFIDDINVSIPVVVYNRDLAIISIDKPAFVECNTNLTAQATVKNKGTETITAFNISYQFDNGPAQTTAVTGISLLPNTTMQVNLTPGFTATVGSHSITVYSSNPVTSSGTGDQFVNNDTLTKSLGVPGSINAPLIEGFESSFPPPNWAVANPDADLTWAKANVGKNSATSAFIRNFTYSFTGRVDDLYSPIMNYSAVDSVLLSFDLAAATGSVTGSNPLDTLEILVTKDCGNSVTSVYKKWGSDLQTINNSLTTEFIPNNDQWRRETIDLTKNNIPAGAIQVIFRATTGFGNNVYIDNVNLIVKTLPVKLKEQGYLILPNPFTSEFNIWHLQPPTDLRYVTIYNSVGQMVWKQQYNGNAAKIITVDLGRQSAGIYIVNLWYNNKAKNIKEKIIKF